MPMYSRHSPDEDESESELEMYAYIDYAGNQRLVARRAPPAKESGKHPHRGNLAEEEIRRT